MAVYDLIDEIQTIYDVNGNELDEAYDIEGDAIYTSTPDPYIDGRTLVFEDSFDGSALNDENWSYEIGNVRNNESQFYRSQNVAVKGGKLVITAKRETHLNKAWTSGSITGQLKQSWLYGRFEAKIKFPNVVGAFGAFWLLGANHWIEYSDDDDSAMANSRPEGSVKWPDCGEIDVVETIPGDATSMQANLWSYTGYTLGKGYSSDIDSSEWNIYAMEWTSEYIAMLLDGVEYKRWTFSSYGDSVIQAYRLPQYIILNLAVGSAGGVPESSTDEMKMYVDWVRVYAPLESD